MEVDHARLRKLLERMEQLPDEVTMWQAIQMELGKTVIVCTATDI